MSRRTDNERLAMGTARRGAVRLLSVRFRTCFALAVLVICYLGSARAADRPRPLTTIASIEAYGAQSRTPRRVDLRAQITYIDAEWHMLFVRDASGQLYVNARTDLQSLHAGEVVRIVGMSSPGAMGAYVVASRVEAVRQAPLVPSAHASLAALQIGEHENGYISTEGVLRPGPPIWNHTSVLLADGDTSVSVILPIGTETKVLDMTGARVRVTGVSADRLDSAHHRLGAVLYVQNLSRIVPITLWKNVLDAPAQRITDIQKVDPSQRFVPAMHVRGKVLWHAGQSFVLQDDSGTVNVQVSSDPNVQYGEIVDVVGFPHPGGDSIMLIDGLVQYRGQASAATPKVQRMSLAKVARKAQDGDLLTVSGNVLFQSDSNGMHRFRIASHGVYLDVYVASAGGDNALPNVAPGSVLRTTGVFRRVRHDGRSTSLQLLVDSPARIEIENSHPMSWEALAACIILAVLLWIIQMRRALKSNTAQIRLRLEQEAQLENRYRRLFERNLAAVFSWRPSGEITDCNQAFARMLGFKSPAQVIGNCYWSLLAEPVHPDGNAPAPDWSTHERESSLRRADGSTVYLLENTTLVEDANGEQHFETTALDVTQSKLDRMELQRARDAAQRDAEIDPLTGLPNRRGFAAIVKRRLQVPADKRRKVALSYLDLDGFKAVNDTLGHLAGDMLLREVTARLAASLLPGDMVSRIGGDEFAILLTREESVDQPSRIAETLLDCLKQSFKIYGQELTIGASIGIGVFPDSASDYSSLMQQADSAMYLAKRTGRNRVVTYAPEIGSALQERSRIAAELNGAVARREISIHYQPEFNRLTQRVVRLEALARWNNHSLGEVSPAKFIPIAEECGLIVELGKHLLEMACRDAVAWQRKTGQFIPVAVNISAVQLRSDGFVETVLETLQRTGLRPELLELEMTESMMLEGMDECRQRLTRLRAAGVRLALDDFGTGYSTLSYLPELPFDRLKIDRRFLARAYNGRGGEALIRAVISIGHTFGLAVVVEGIETAKDLDFVNSMNPDEIQGFLLGKPNPDPCAIIEHHFGDEKPEPGNDATSRDARLTQAGLNIAAV